MNRHLVAKVTAAVCGMALLGGAGAYALGGAAPHQSPAKVSSTEDGSAGSLVYRTAYGSIDGTSYDTVRRACPKGTHATGGGYAMGADPGSFFVIYDRPYDSQDADYFPDDGWEIYVYNNTSNTISASVRVICSK